MSVAGISRAFVAYATLATVAGCGAAPGVMPRAQVTQPQRRSDAQKYRILFSFQGAPDEGFPAAGLAAVGRTLYGTTSAGGAYDNGTVFSLHTRGGWKVLLYSFRRGSDGANPVAGLLAYDGKLYGTTEDGGAYGQGTVFRVDLNGKETVLHSFGKAYDGAAPTAGLTLLNGALYGTTHKGGTYGYGTVFRVGMTGAERVLHSFSVGYGFGSDGGYPVAGLIAVSGVLYGTTISGGSNAAGTMFTVSADGSEKVLYNFNGSLPAARDPDAPLVLFKDRLYGTTVSGGANDYGTVFSISPSGKNEVVLHSFGPGSSDGTEPEAGLVLMNGKFYGTTYAGGAGAGGTVFTVTTAGEETVLHSFGSGYRQDGRSPEAGLIAVNRKLYGTTYGGGVSNAGTVFTLTP